MTPDVTKTRRTMWDATFNSVALGGLMEVDLSGVKLKLQPVKIGSLGDIKLDDRAVGVEDGAVVKIVVVQTDRTMLNAVQPLGGTGSGTNASVIELAPPVNTLAATGYAHSLILHPRDMAADVSEDVEFYKAVMISTAPVKRTGMVDDAWELMFNIYPDTSKLPGNAWWRIKAGA